MVGTWWHCGIPLQEILKLVAILDILIGVLSTTLVAVYFEEIQNYFKSRQQNNIIQKSSRRQPLPPEFAIVILVISAAQIIMGIILYFGTVKKSCCLCVFWMTETLLTSFYFLNFIPRLYGVIAVANFLAKMKVERNSADFTGSSTPTYGREMEQASVPESGESRIPSASASTAETLVGAKEVKNKIKMNCTCS